MSGRPSFSAKLIHVENKIKIGEKIHAILYRMLLSLFPFHLSGENNNDLTDQRVCKAREGIILYHSDGKLEVPCAA